MPAKIVVTSVKGGSKISLLGSSGKELLSSVVFQEPRAKGATLRALKGLLGDTIVEDNTIKGPKSSASPAVAPKATPAPAPAAEAEPEAVEAPAPSPRKSASKKVSAAKKTVARKVAAKKAEAETVGAEVVAKVAAARKTTKRATARP